MKKVRINAKGRDIVFNRRMNNKPDIIMKSMKNIKRITYLCILCTAFGFLTACNSNVSTKEISVTGSDGKTYTSYRTACSNVDFDAAREYVEKMKEKLVVVKADGEEEEIEAFAEAVQEAEDYVENEEVQYLASLNEEQANNRIILILNQRPIAGLEAAEMTCLGKHIDHDYIENNIWEDRLPDVVQNFKKYILWCGKFNTRCSNILAIAISCGNHSLAKKILHCFKPDPELLIKDAKKGEHDYDDYKDIYAHYTNTSIDAAQKKYDEAVKSGAFSK